MTLEADRRSILRGMKGAMRLLQDLGYDQGAKRAQRVDVFDSIDRRGAALMFQPLDRLLGAFMKQDDAAGIILNTERPLGMQRFTAAHELGHLALGHDPHADDEGILRRGPIADSRFNQVPPEEREADAFASFFLLPSHLITAQMEVQGWDVHHVTSPEIVYQASLRFGTSYAGAVYGLERESVITRGMRQQLLKAKPKDLKLDLLDGQPLPNARRSDVWLLTERDEGAVIEAGRDDLFLLRLNEATGAGYVWTFDELKAAGFAILKDGREPVPEGVIGSPTVRRIIAQAGYPTANTLKLKECRPWDPDDDPQTLTLHYRTATSDEAGLFERQRLERLALQ
ncbi:ImmA/IrrE family metallo-endopeptidase [Marivita sp. S0852]|uniref:ImmA/IrrE family metallo-endopeptidase n=1 Tax=Marivita sp. S0852 TaxID=3373893 RepID=UPI003982260C